MNCRDCKYYKQDGESEYGTCHYYPPKVIVVDGNPVTVFPMTNDNNMCSCYENINYIRNK